jgi:hypothetical protein
MHFEPSSDENLISLNYQSVSAEEPQVAYSNNEKIAHVLGEGINEAEAFALAKAPTLMLNLEQEFDYSVHSPFQSVIDNAPRYYVQGVVTGHRACIITNLLGGVSQTLLQPQMVWTIGRNRDAALPLRDRALSRRHAVILFLPNEGFYLVDLNSMNGSFLNGARVQQRQRLNDGDVLRMGSVEFNFFVSSHSKSVSPIHPEVLARFTNPATQTEKFIDYAALEEPEVLFSTTRES